MKRYIIAALVVVTAILAVPSMAHAGNCGGWYSYNLDGEAASVSNVRPKQGMNCASSRYVANKWLRKSYQRQYANRLPTHFYDGYVTWYCGKTGSYRWRCDEYDSGTAFTFRAVYHG